MLLSQEVTASTVLVWLPGASMEKEENEVDFSALRQNVKINQLPGQWVLGRKDWLARCYQAMKENKKCQHFDFHPRTFLLPLGDRETQQIKDCFDGKSATFMIKPVNWFSGLGIKITNNLEEILQTSGNVLVQEYIERPLLVNRRKFDVRVYLLVTSLDPLRVFLYQDGIVSICSEEYTTTHHSKAAHMTNYSVNKTHHSFCLKNQRRSLSDLRRELEREQGVDWSQVWDRTKEVCLNMVICGLQQMREEFQRAGVRSHYNCFKLFGCDILYDQHLKPWLLEVGQSTLLLHEMIFIFEIF